jgi:hypothetical protein
MFLICLYKKSNKIPTDTSLREIWKRSNDLNLTACPYNTFGLNVFSVETVSEFQSTVDIFGDKENIKLWFKESGTPEQSVSNLSNRSVWVCIGCYNEFDFIFVQVNKNSPWFGKVKVMVNNCCTERFLEPSDGSDTLVETLLIETLYRECETETDLDQGV